MPLDDEDMKMEACRTALESVAYSGGILIEFYSGAN